MENAGKSMEQETIEQGTIERENGKEATMAPGGKKRGQKEGNQKKRHGFLKLLLFAAALCALASLAVWLFRGRWNFRGKVSGEVPRKEMSYVEAMSDGVLSELEIAEHFAPEIDAAVNVMISCGGRGDFLAAVDYDGDWAADNNWEHLNQYPLEAVVYYSVQETKTHYFVGYYFYHPRDDAEIWLDCHENDFEGIMLAVRKPTSPDEASFGTVELMYTQGHGYVPFYFDHEEYAMTEGSTYGGGLLFDGDRPVIYITPNGTLSNAGHSVESAKDHSTYWAVGNSGIHYYYGGVAEEPATYKGRYEKNRCSYALSSLEVLWERKDGPYGSGNVFATFGEFCGDNYRKNAANPPWGWRNKTAFGYGGSFLSDPAWTFTKAVDGPEMSAEYLDNRYAVFRVAVESVALSDAAAAALPAGTRLSLAIYQGSWCLSGPAWWSVVTGTGETSWEVSFGITNAIYVAAAKDTQWRIALVTQDGQEIEAEIDASVELLP